MSTLVIGCGNSGRSDDAAGLLVVRKLRAMGVHAIEQECEAMPLLDKWNGYARVILVDAVVTGKQPGELTAWDASKERVPRECFHCSTHVFGVADAIELGRILDRLPPQLSIYGIEAARLDAGSEVTVPVADAIDRVARQIRDEVIARKDPH